MHEDKEDHMSHISEKSRFSEIARITGIKEWWFEIAMGERELLKPPSSDLDELRTFAYQSPNNSEEKFSGYLHWVKALSEKAVEIKDLNEAIFILKHTPPWHTMAGFRANHALNRFEADKHPQAYRREYLDEQGTIAYFLRQVELAENYEEYYELFRMAQHRCVVVISTIMEKMQQFATSVEELKEIHDQSLPWYPTKLGSLKKMVELFETKQLKT